MNLTDQMVVSPFGERILAIGTGGQSGKSWDWLAQIISPMNVNSIASTAMIPIQTRILVRRLMPSF
jgi:hypothetical protein